MRSASTGPASSTNVSTTKNSNIVVAGTSTNSSNTQPIWETVIVSAYVWQVRRRAGSWWAARSHCDTMGTRMTT